MKQLYLVHLELHGPEPSTNCRKSKNLAEATLLPKRQPSTNHSALTAPLPQGTRTSVLISPSSSSTDANTTHAVLVQEYSLYNQPLSHIHACVAQFLTKISNFLNQKSAMFWDLTCSFFPFSKQSPWGGFPPKALDVDGKRNALFSCHTATSMSEPGLHIVVAHLGLSCLILFLTESSCKEVTSMGRRCSYRVYRWRQQGLPHPAAANNC